MDTERLSVRIASDTARQYRELAGVMGVPVSTLLAVASWIGVESMRNGARQGLVNVHISGRRRVVGLADGLQGSIMRAGRGSEEEVSARGVGSMGVESGSQAE